MNLRPGATLGSYTIIERIGRGGMSTVYKAYQPSLSRQVAIKVLPPYFDDDDEMRRRFQQEALTVANLQHPNILVVYEYGEQDGMIYLVSELVDGGTLQEMVGSQQTVEMVVRLLGPIAAALDFAHARGVLHRDVKPGNILLRRDGTPVLSDFGLVRMLHSPSARLTRTGLTVGTPEYMAPEQGSTEGITAAADNYGLAVMAYELLTGRVPFSAETPMAVLLAHMQEQPAPPSELNPSLPTAIDAVLLKGLAKQPAGRYGSAAALIEALEAAARGEEPIDDGAKTLENIDATLAAADRRAAVAADVVAMVGTATARRRLRSTVLGSGAVAAALLVAAIWAIVHNAGPSTAAHPEAAGSGASPTGTSRGVAAVTSARGTTREQAALPVLPSNTPSATMSRTATAVPTDSPTAITLPASDGDLPHDATPTATATATRRPASPTRTPTRLPTATATPKAARPVVAHPSATARRATPAPRRATPTPHNVAAREVAAVGARPPQPTRRPTPPPPTPTHPHPTPTRPAPTATPRPAIPLVGHPTTRPVSTPHATRRSPPQRATPTRPKTVSKHHGPTPQLVLVGHRPMPVARKPARRITAKTGQSGHTGKASHGTKRKTTGQKAKKPPANRHTKHRQGSLKITVKH